MLAIDKQMTDADMKTTSAAIAAGAATPILDQALQTALASCAKP